MLLDFLVRDFIQIIRKIECSTGYPIKILALDFDCTLIPFHTGGSYQIYDQDGNFKNDLLKIFFPNPDFIHLLVTKLRENGIQPAIASHSDPRFNDKDKGLIGGQKLILSLLKRLFPNDNIFNVKNVIAYSNPYNGTFTNKNMHIKQLVDNYNQNGMNQNYGWNKPKFDDIRNVKWDCIIVDEVHYGYETDKSKEIVEGLDFKYCLALSATPFVNYFRNTFDFSNTHRWTIFDEIQRSKTDPIYASYPEMHFLLFAPPKNIYSEYLNEYIEEDGLTWNKLLRVKEDGTFFYEKDIDTIIKFVFGEKNSNYNSRNTPFGWAREHGIDKAKGKGESLKSLDKKN